MTERELNISVKVPAWVDEAKRLLSSAAPYIAVGVVLIFLCIFLSLTFIAFWVSVYNFWDAHVYRS